MLSLIAAGPFINDWTRSRPGSDPRRGIEHEGI